MSVVFQIVLGILALAVALPIVFVAVVWLISIASVGFVEFLSKKWDK